MPLVAANNSMKKLATILIAALMVAAFAAGADDLKLDLSHCIPVGSTNLFSVSGVHYDAFRSRYISVTAMTNSTERVDWYYDHYAVVNDPALVYYLGAVTNNLN